MKKLLSLVACAAITLCAGAQLNISQLGHYDYQAARGSDLSNLWGYTDEEGNEYALVGVDGENGNNNSGGLSVVNVTDPDNPVEVFFTPGPNSIWREIKTYGNYAYVTTEASAGLLIVDLSPLPQSTVLPTTLFQGNGWITAHSLFIDETIGRLYLNGSNRGNGGTIMYDLTQDPMAPVEVGSFDQWYVHDCFARGNTLYAAHINDGFFSIVDVTDPASPVLEGTQQTPNIFTHNCWLDDSGQYLFTTDEKPNSYVASYDVSDPSDIQFLDKLQTAPGSNAIVHNTYWLDHFVVQSYYTEGVSIYDVTEPGNMVEVGHYDTSPFTGDGFNGAWGVYPFLPSGRLLISDIEGGLYILGPTYVRACWLEGTITDAQTTNEVNGATITLVGAGVGDVTGFDGQYSTGTATAGTYDVLVHAPGYVDRTVSAVLVNGEITIADVALEPLASFSYSGLVLEEGTNAPIAGATVQLMGSENSYVVTTNADGGWSVPSMFEASYAITVGHWGHRTVCLDPFVISSASLAITTTLPVGYYDDMALDFGWTITGTATSGMWERGVPVGTTYNDVPCAPGADVNGDCADQALVTGNGGGDAGDDDVDNGTAIATSPVFDISAMPDPWVRYQRWFFNGGGMGSPNDRLLIQLTNGTDTVVISTINASSPNAHTWVMEETSILAHITPSSTMRFIARTADDSPGHLVEAGLDLFEILPNSPFASVAEHGAATTFTLWPSPNDGHFQVNDPKGGAGMLSLFDATGRLVGSGIPMLNGHAAVAQALADGLYTVRLVRADGSRSDVRMMVR